jgi:hypothetical protein
MISLDCSINSSGTISVKRSDVSLAFNRTVTSLFSMVTLVKKYGLSAYANLYNLAILTARGMMVYSLKLC